MKILLGMPCMKTIPYKTVGSLLQTMEKDKVDVLLVEGSLVYDSRDLIAKHAVNEGYDYVLYADSDMVFNKSDVENLLKHQVGICSGLYVKRNGEMENVAYIKIIKRRRWPFRSPKLIPDGATTGFGEIAACGFGFCLIKTTVIKTMFKYYKSLFEPKWGVGEDISFCIRARQIGYKTFIDHDVKLGHVGDMVYKR